MIQLIGETEVSGKNCGTAMKIVPCSRPSLKLRQAVNIPWGGLPGKTVVYGFFLTDNESLVSVLNRQSSKEPLVMGILRKRAAGRRS